MQALSPIQRHVQRRKLLAHLHSGAELGLGGFRIEWQPRIGTDGHRALLRVLPQADGDVVGAGLEIAGGQGPATGVGCGREPAGSVAQLAGIKPHRAVGQRIADPG